MAINPEVKKYAIVGGALVLAVIGGVWAYKHFENSGAAAAGAADQSNQDTLAYEMEQLAAGSGQGSYGSGTGTQTSFGSETSQPSQSLADEIKSLEEIFNPPATPAPAASVSPVSAPATPAPVTAVPAPVSSAPVQPVAPQQQRLAQAEAPILQHEGVTVA